MMCRFKQAREDVQAYFDGVSCDPVEIIFKIHGQTILTALNALERMQAVDLEKMKRKMRNPIEQGGKSNDWYQNGYDVGYNAAIDDIMTAQTLADMKKEIEG